MWRNGRKRQFRTRRSKLISTQFFPAQAFHKADEALGLLAQAFLQVGTRKLTGFVQ
jgi:hypothetical protein